MPAPHRQQLAGSGIAWCGLALACLLMTAILVVGSLQASIESDAAVYKEFSSSDCSGATLSQLEFGKGSTCVQVYSTSAAKNIWIQGSCSMVNEEASLQICADASCSAGCVPSSFAELAFNNCTTGGAVATGSKSVSITCVDRQQSLKAGVGVTATILISLTAVVALVLLADLHNLAKKYVPCLDFTAEEGRSGSADMGATGHYELMGAGATAPAS